MQIKVEAFDWQQRLEGSLSGTDTLRGGAEFVRAVYLAATGGCLARCWRYGWWTSARDGCGMPTEDDAW
jgi:hypothetical protein